MHFPSAVTANDSSPFIPWEISHCAIVISQVTEDQLHCPAEEPAGVCGNDSVFG